jgi:hypothetical protein
VVGPLGFVLLVTPGRAFLEGERRAIDGYRAQPGAASQILPVSRAEERNKTPEPLDEHFLRTIVPIVIEYPPRADGTVPNVPRGGRFRELRELDIEVRVGHEALREATVAGALNDATLDKIESVMLRELLGQIRVRKTIEQAAESLFKKTLGYNWRVIKKDRLLFEVEQRRESPLTPGLRLRLLVLCWPYASVLGHAVKSMTELIRRRARTRHCQYGLMIYSDSFSSIPNKLELLEEFGGDLMVLDLREVEGVAWMVQGGGGKA